MPGFIDVQTHLTSQPGLPSTRSRLIAFTEAKNAIIAMNNAKRSLGAGFTSVRDMGNHGYSMYAVADAIEAGRIEGPRMQVAGEIIQPSGSGHRKRFRSEVEALVQPSAVCDGPADCARAVRENVAMGSTTIKVEAKRDLTPASQSQFTLAELKAIRNTAHSLGLKVTASSFSADSINLPLEAGFDGVVHAPFPDARSFALLKRHDAYYIPTLAAAHVVLDMANDPATPVSDAWRRENRLIHDRMVAGFRSALDKGVKIAFGTDAGWRHHNQNARQMVEMVGLGMTPAAVLKSATYSAADAMGWQGIVGVLEVGAFADFVAMRSSPLLSIEQVLDPMMVIKGGQIIASNSVNEHRRPDMATIIHAGTLYSHPDRPLSSAQSIIIENGTITAIKSGFMGPDELGLPDARVVNLREQFVMPGMMDTHVHLTTISAGIGKDEATSNDADLAIVAAKSAKAILEAGFTTVMDLGASKRADEIATYAVRDAIADGILPGPEVRYAGAPLSIPGHSRTASYRDRIASALSPQGVCVGADGCRAIALEQFAKGADFLNIYHTGGMFSDESPAQTFTNAELAAIQGAAESLGRIVVADGGNTVDDASGINAAIRAGILLLDTGTYPDAETFELLKQHGGYFAPHLYALSAAIGPTFDTLNQGSMGWLPRETLEEIYRIKNEPQAAVAAYRAGVKLVLASDSGVFPHGENARELISYVEHGISAEEALAAATLNAAVAHGISHRTGSIEVGKEADIIAVAASPLLSIEAILDMRFVMSDGRIHLQR